MSDGRVYYADRNGNYLLKFVGDVRVTLCTTLNDYINVIFAAEDMQSVIVDLTEAKAVDSTTLGFMAKVAIYANKRGLNPVLITSNSSMIRLVESMGLEEIFSITDELPDDIAELEKMNCVAGTADEARGQVIDAHKTLMSLNSKNMKTFSSLVKALENEVH